MSVFILAKSYPDNKNFYNENGILETGTGEILSDPRKTERSDLENAQGKQPEIIRII